MSTLQPLTPEDLVPPEGIEPVTLKIWADPRDGEAAGLRFVLLVPKSQVGTQSADLGTYLTVVVGNLFVDSQVPITVQQGRVH